jgi:hypothetical protein
MQSDLRALCASVVNYFAFRLTLAVIGILPVLTEKMLFKQMLINGLSFGIKLNRFQRHLRDEFQCKRILDGVLSA